MKTPSIIINGKTLTPAQAAAVAMCVISTHDEIGKLDQTKTADEWIEHLTEVILIMHGEQR